MSNVMGYLSYCLQGRAVPLYQCHLMINNSEVTRSESAGGGKADEDNHEVRHWVPLFNRGNSPP